MSYYAGSSYYPTAYPGSSYGVPMARSYSGYDTMMPQRQYYPTPMYAPSAPIVVSSSHHRPSYSSYPMGMGMGMQGTMPYYGSNTPTVIISRSGRSHHRRSSSSSSRSSSRHRHGGFLHYL